MMRWGPSTAPAGVVTHALTFNDLPAPSGERTGNRLESKEYPVFLNVIKTKQQNPWRSLKGMYVKPNRSSCECWRAIYAFYARKGELAGVRLSATMWLLSLCARLSPQCASASKVEHVSDWLVVWGPDPTLLVCSGSRHNLFPDRSVSTHALTHRHTSTQTLRSQTRVHHNLHSPLGLCECVYAYICIVNLCVHVREHFSLNLCVCANPVWLHRGAEVSDCLVSVGGKLWRFALTVNLEEFLMELQSCQTSKCCTFFFPRWKERWLDPLYTTWFWKSEGRKTLVNAYVLWKKYHSATNSAVNCIIEAMGGGKIAQFVSLILFNHQLK